MSRYLRLFIHDLEHTFHFQRAVGEASRHQPLKVSPGNHKVEFGQLLLRACNSPARRRFVRIKIRTATLTGGGIPDREAVRSRHTPVRQEPESARNTRTLSKEGKEFIALAQ